MKKLFSFALLCCALVAMQAQTNTRVLGTPLDDEFKSIIQAANGDWILGGTRTVGANKDYVLTRTNAAGTTVVWTHTYGNVNQADNLIEVLEEPNNNLVFLGESAGAVELFRVSSAGAVVGIPVQIPPTSGTFLPQDLLRLANGNFAVGGIYHTGGSSSFDCLLVGVANNLGSILWGNRYPSNNNNADWINAITQAATGEIVAIGAENASSLHDGTFHRFNSSTGALIGSRRYPRTRNDGFNGIVQLTNGDYIILGAEKNDNSGSATNYNSTNIKLMRVDSTGTYLWERAYANNGLLTGEHEGAIRLQGNQVIVAGITNRFSTNPAVNGNNGGNAAYLAGISLDGLTVNWSKLDDVNTASTSAIQTVRLVATATAAMIGISTNNRPFVGETALNRNFLFAENSLSADTSGCIDRGFPLTVTSPAAITPVAIAPTTTNLNLLGENPVYSDSILVGRTNTGCFCSAPVATLSTLNTAAYCNSTATIAIANAAFPSNVIVTGPTPSNTNVNASPFTLSNLCPGSYSVIVSGPGGCADTVTFSIENICQGFNVAITAINLAYPSCGSNVDILISGGATSLPASVQTNWIGGGAAAITANSNAFNISGECPQTYTTYITSAQGCKDTIYYVIPTCVDSAICVGSTVILSAWDNKFHAPLVGGNQITGNWLTNGVASGSGTTLTISPTANTNYIFNGALYNVVNGVSTFVQFVNFCVNISLTTPPTLTATASPATICAGQTSTLSVTGGGGMAVYRWFRMPATNLGTGATKVVSPATTTTYYAIVDCVPCTDTVWVTVNVVQPTQATITGPSAICGTQNVTLTATGGGTYAWRLTPSNTVIATTAALTVANVSTTRTYNVTVTNAPCATTTASQTITVNSIPVVTLPVPSGCKIVGQPLTFNASSSNISTWTWGNVPNTPTGIASTATTSAATYMMVSGANAVSVTATDANGCTKTVTTSVTPSALTTTITKAQSGPCNSYKFTAVLAGSNVSTGTALTYSWVFKNLTANTQVSQTTTAPTNFATQLFAAPGIDNYEVCVYITTTLGCTSFICMNPNLPACTCNIAANFCSTVGTPAASGTAVPVTFTNGSTGGGATSLAYTWSWGDGTANTVTTSINAQTHSFASNVTNSNVELTVTGTANGMQCCQRVVIPVSIPAPCPITSANVTGFNYRQNATGSIIFYANVVAPAGCTYLWNYGNGATSTAVSPTYTYPVAGTYNACLTITHTATGCNKTFCQSIIATVPSCNIIPRYTATRCTGSAMDISFTAIDNTSGTAPAGVTYNWNFGDGMTQSTATATTVHTYAVVGTYTVCLQKITANCTTNVCHTFNVQLPTYTNCSPAPSGLKTSQGGDDKGSEELVPLDGNNWLINKVEVVPNPAKGLTNLHFNLSKDVEVNMEAFSLEGKVVWEKTSSLNAGHQAEEINLSGWAAGMYIIRVRTGDEVQNIKLVVEN